jgi:hypothetical protein
MPTYDMDVFAYDTLNMQTAQLDDLEWLRMSITNRLRILTTPKDQVDKDGKTRGHGLTRESDPNIVLPIEAALTGTLALEKDSIKAVERYMRRSPWRSFLDDEKTRGVGAKQLARLLGATKDPAWNHAAGRPRTVSELWSYCGYAVVDGAAPRRARGQKANWSHDARSRARMIAESCLKSGGHYAEIYYASKEHYQGAVHVAECAQCGKGANKVTGTPGVPALAGSPLKDGHVHARALRAISKELLKDLWVEARRHRGLTVEPGAPLVARTGAA